MIHALRAWLAVALLAACGDPALIETGDAAIDDGGRDAGAQSGFDAGPIGALALLSVIPDHGPFSGGNAVVLRGTFGPNTRVRFGGVEIPEHDLRAIDPSRLEVRAPAGSPGAVEVVVERDGETAALPGGYTYDPIALSPTKGPPGGGTRVRLTAASDVFVAGQTTVTFGGAACTGLTITDARTAECRTPAGSIGSVDVAIATGGATITLEDGFAYEDPFRRFGGLGGGPLDGTLTVMVRRFNGDPLENAYVNVGGAPDSPHQGRTDSRGMIVFTGDDLRGPQSIYVADYCHHVTSFVGFDAAVVSVLLRLHFLGSPCTDGGGGFSDPPAEPKADAEGEIVFYAGQEFATPTFDWVDVPAPAAGQTRVAFVAAFGPRDLLNGDGSSATPLTREPIEVLESGARGTLGFRFSASDIPSDQGAATFVALAGLRGADGEFTPYVAGVSAPTLLAGRSRVTGIQVRMDTKIGAGRSVSAAAVPGAPFTVVNTSYGIEVLAPIEGPNRLRVQTRYSIPGVMQAVPLFGIGGVPDDDFGTGALSIARQPEAGGRFARAVQELFVIQYAVGGGAGGGGPPPPSDGDNWYGQPHSRALLRVPLSTAAIQATEFMPLPRFTQTPGSALATDRTVRFELEAPAATLLVGQIKRPAGTRSSQPVVYLYMHPSARAVRIPDFSGQPDLPSIDSATQLIEVTVLDAPGIEFNEIDTRALDQVGASGSSMNRTTVEVP